MTLYSLFVVTVCDVVQSGCGDCVTLYSLGVVTASDVVQSGCDCL